MSILSDSFINKVFQRLNELQSSQLQEFINQLIQERGFFGAILNSLIEGIIVIDLDNRIKYLNKPASGYLGLTSKNVLEKNILNIFPANPRQVFSKILQKKDSVITIQECVFPEPISKVFSLNAYPYKNQENQVSGQVIVLLDITLKIAEEKRMKEMESLASLTNLAAGVAHEIKNPLGALDIHVQLLERVSKKFPIEYREPVQEYIAVLVEEIHRLNEIIKDFLFTVRPMKIELKNVDLEALIKDIINMFYYDLKEKEIGINLHTPSLPKIETLYVMLDERHIKQAFINLIKNAIEACDRKDRIAITIDEKDDYISVTIRDTGKGIPQEIVEHIFEPYFTTKDFGTGLGLTLTLKIIKEHGGSIKVESKEAEGTTFLVTLPKYYKGPKLIKTQVKDQ